MFITAGGRNIIIRTRQALLLAVLIPVISAAGMNIAGAASSEPGSQEDPLAAKSYVDLKISEIATILNSRPVPAVLEIIELKKSQQLLMGTGTQIIVRTGTAKVIAGTYGGLSDLTNGSGLDKTGDNLELNHLLLSYREDGRGISVESDSAWIAVTGTYVIK